MQTQSITAIATEFSCTRSTVVASFVSSLITALIAIGVSIAIHIGVWFRYKKPRSNEPGHQVCQGERYIILYTHILYLMVC